MKLTIRSPLALLSAAFACVTLASGCGSEPSSGDSNVGEVQSAVLGTQCVGSQHQCWTGTGSNQALSFDDDRGFRWFIKAADPTLVVPFNHQWPAGYVDNNGHLSSSGVSVTTQLAFGNGYVYVLTSDGVVHYSFGKANFIPADPSQDKLDGVNFAHWTTFIQPLDKLGNRLCLSKISSTPLPTNFQQGSVLLALSCSGSAYVQDALASGETRWMPAQQHPGFSGLPSLTWADISDISRNNGGGATLLGLTARDVYVGGTGGIVSGDGTVHWNPVVKLPRINVGSVRLAPRSVGGFYVITNAGNDTCTLNVGCDGDIDRFYHYNSSTLAWERPTDGTPWIPVNAMDITTPNEFPYIEIFDTGTGFAVHHMFSWMLTWHL